MTGGVWKGVYRLELKLCLMVKDVTCSTELIALKLTDVTSFRTVMITLSKAILTLKKSCKTWSNERSFELSEVLLGVRHLP